MSRPTYQISNSATRRPTDELLGGTGDDGSAVWLIRRCRDGSRTLWLSKQYCVEDVTTNASILEALQKDNCDTLKMPQDGRNLVHLKPDTYFTNEDQKEPRCIAAWVVQCWGEDSSGDCTNCKDGKGVFVDCRTFKGLFDGACGNCKKRDHGAQCSHSNAFKKAAEEREKAFKKPGPRTTRAAQKARAEEIEQ